MPEMKSLSVFPGQIVKRKALSLNSLMPNTVALIASKDAVIIPGQISSLYIVGRCPAEKMHAHPRSSFKCHLKLPFLKYNLWRPLAITWFLSVGVRVGWHLLTVISYL